MAELVPVEPFDIVVFGATGDLARRKLIPALFHRWCDNQIPQESRIVAVARDDLSDDAFRASVAEFAAPGDAGEARRDQWASFIGQVRYIPVESEGEGEGWTALSKALDPNPDKVRIFYLALPPSIYGKTCQAIGAQGLNTRRSRVILEKPIGYDFHSARRINDAVGEVFPEDSIFRIDHYLGKETVQNLLILRFANMLLEPVWNADGVDHSR